MNSEIRKDGNVFDLVDESGAHTTTDTLARANLYANAPELLAALIALVDHAQEQEANFDNQRGQTEIDAGIKAAEKAIGKKWMNIKREDI